MFKLNPYFAGLFAVAVAGLTQAPAFAAAAIAKDSNDRFYYSTRSSEEAAYSGVLQYCSREGGSNCTVVNSDSSGGWGAVATSPSRYGAALSYRSKAAAVRAALNSCARETPRNETCRVVLTFFDDFR
ncbi:DUF4189 domain-containing protein [Pseudanabaenaceae cyanobacterium LEGE 13415]|nr:DUF4189 domain-containing protein [Pseudanabaenaceae cyanobacterium LEGE 13415]